MTGRQAVLTVVAVLALGGASYLLFFRGGDNPRIQQRPRSSGVCLATSWQGDAYADFAETPPLKCPDCGRKTFYPYWYCEDSKVRFVPDLRLFQPGGGFPYGVRCPKTGSMNCSAWIPEFHTEYTDWPLPSLPS